MWNDEVNAEGKSMLGIRAGQGGDARRVGVSCGMMNGIPSQCLFGD